MRTISVRIEFDSLVEDGSYDAVETCRLNHMCTYAMFSHLNYDKSFPRN